MKMRGRGRAGVSGGARRRCGEVRDRAGTGGSTNSTGGAAQGRPRCCSMFCAAEPDLELAAAGALPVLVAAALGSLRLGLARLARLLVEALATHVPEHSRAQHAPAELLQRPIQAIGLRELNLDHVVPSAKEKR